MDQSPAAVSALPPASRLAKLHHELRSVLAAASLSLETTRLINEAVSSDPGLARSIDRALSSLQEALRIAEEIRAAENRVLSTPASEPTSDSAHRVEN